MDDAARPRPVCARPLRPPRPTLPLGNFRRGPERERQVLCLGNAMRGWLHWSEVIGADTFPQSQRFVTSLPMYLAVVTTFINSLICSDDSTANNLLSGWNID